MSEQERPPRFDFRPGGPDVSLFPRSAWLASLRRALGNAPDARLDYGDPRGAPELRRALARYLGRVRGVAADPERTIVTSGMAQGMAIFARALVSLGGRRIAIEDPSSGPGRAQLASNGLKILPVPVDEHGLAVDALELEVDELGGHLRLGGRNLELRPVGHFGLRQHGHGGRELERAVLFGQAVELDLGGRDGPDPGVLGRAPEPRVEVALQRLLPHGVAAHAGDDDRNGRFPLPETGQAKRRRHVAGGVLEGVLEVGLGDFYIQADAAFRELFDGGFHSRPLCQKGLETRSGLVPIYLPTYTWWKSMTSRSGLCRA